MAPSTIATPPRSPSGSPPRTPIMAKRGAPCPPDAPRKRPRVELERLTPPYADKIETRKAPAWATRTFSADFNVSGQPSAIAKRARADAEEVFNLLQIVGRKEVETDVVKDLFGALPADGQYEAGENGGDADAEGADNIDDGAGGTDGRDDGSEGNETADNVHEEARGEGGADTAGR